MHPAAPSLCTYADIPPRHAKQMDDGVTRMYHGNPQTFHGTPMNLDETIRLQALKQKQLTTQGSDHDFVDMVLRHQPEVPEQMRNICATISTTLFNEVENCCSMLDLSKRRFVELALQDALAKAATIIDEVDPFMGGQH